MGKRFKKPSLVNRFAKEGEVSGTAYQRQQKGFWQNQRLPIEVINSHRNFHWITSQWNETMFDLKHQLLDKKPMINIGSGASLDTAAKLLPDWKGHIICNDSQAASLMYHHAPPSYICVMDPKVQNPAKLAVEKWDPQCRTIFWPCVDKVMVQAAPGWHRRYLFRMYSSGSQWYNFMKKAYGFIETEVMPMAASVQSQLSMSQYLGHTPIFLAGVDMGAKRATEWRYLQGKWRSSKREDPFLNHKTFDGKVTSGALLHHKLSLLVVCLLGLNKLPPEQAIPIQTSRDGIIDELPYVPLEEVIRKEGKIKLPPEEYERAKYEIELYMASKDEYFIRCGNGYRMGGILFISGMPYEELPKRMDEIDEDGSAMIEDKELEKKFPGINRDLIKPPDKDAEMRRINELHREIVKRGWWKKDRDSIKGRV